jgi:uncharacterized phage protein (TIGR02220 family)
MPSWTYINLPLEAVQVIPASALKTYCALLSYRDGEGLAWPSVQTIADDIRSSRPTVVRALKTLVEIDVVRRVGTKNTATIYYVDRFDRVVQKRTGSKVNRIKSEPEGGSEVNQQVVQNCTTNNSQEHNPRTKASEVLDYLNEKAGRQFKPTKANLKNINARLGEEYSVSDCKAVIDSKNAEWGNNKKMRQYLRPQTLFSEKFGSYLETANDTKGHGELLSDEVGEDIWLP